MGARESHGELGHSHFLTHTERGRSRASPLEFPAFPVGSVCMLAMTGLPVSFHIPDTTNTFPNNPPLRPGLSSPHHPLPLSLSSRPQRHPTCSLHSRHTHCQFRLAMGCLHHHSKHGGGTSPRHSDCEKVLTPAHTPTGLSELGS